MKKQIPIVRRRSRVGKLIAWVSGILFVFTLFKMFPKEVNPGPVQTRFSALALLIGSIGAFAQISLCLREKRKRLAKICLLTCSATCCFLTAEIFFSSFARSNGNANSLAAVNWAGKYWKTNRNGFRDVEHFAESFKNKKKVFVLGDSFVAGYGVRDPENRFSNILQKRLSQSVEVFNLGLNGFDTSAERRLLAKVELKPDCLVLSYFGNDIDVVASQAGLKPVTAPLFADLNPVCRYFVERSYLLNYLYWLLPKKDSDGYVRFLREAYLNPLALEFHKKDLSSFVDYSRERNVPLVVVLFPFLFDPSPNEIYVKLIKEFFESRQVPVIDVSLMIQGRKPRDVMVNPNDAHPNELVHRLVGEALSKTVSTAMIGTKLTTNTLGPPPH